MPTLPALDRSLLVRTDFSDDEAWGRLADEAQRETEDGFRAYVELVNDPVFDGADWRVVRASVPATGNGAAVLFVADADALASSDFAIVVIDLLHSNRAPFRSVASELWSIDNNLNIANMDWEEFAEAVDAAGVFRGFA